MGCFCSADYAAKTLVISLSTLSPSEGRRLDRESIGWYDGQEI